MFEEPEFWVLVAFVVFAGAAYRPLMRYIAEALDARAEKIRQTLDEAQRLREEAQTVLASYQRQQRDARQEAQDIVEHARVEAERLAQEAASSLEAALDQREKLAMDKIREAEEEARKEVRNLAVDLTIDATQRLITKQLDEAKSDSLVDQAISGLSGALRRDRALPRASGNARKGRRVAPKKGRRSR